jgi:hypothetical protein
MAYRGIPPSNSHYLDLLFQERFYGYHSLALLSSKAVVDTSAILPPSSLTIYQRHFTRDLATQKRMEDGNLAFVKRYKSMHDHADMPRPDPAPRRKRRISTERIVKEIFATPNEARLCSARRNRSHPPLFVTSRAAPRHARPHRITEPASGEARPAPRKTAHADSTTVKLAFETEPLHLENGDSEETPVEVSIQTVGDVYISSDEP